MKYYALLFPVVPSVAVATALPSIDASVQARPSNPDNYKPLQKRQPKRPLGPIANLG